MPIWPRQLARVERWLDRIEAQPGDLGRTEFQDFMWAFFQNCWHLKDWIKNDPDLPECLDRKAIEVALQSSEALMLCADLANRTKHLDLRRRRRDADFDRAHPTDSATVNWNTGEITNRRLDWDWHIVARNGLDRSALEVAREAVSDWYEILDDLGLDAGD